MVQASCGVGLGAAARRHGAHRRAAKMGVVELAGDAADAGVGIPQPAWAKWSTTRSTHRRRLLLMGNQIENPRRPSLPTGKAGPRSWPRGSRASSGPRGNGDGEEAGGPGEASGAEEHNR